MTSNYDIFICYRRDGGFETAKHLNDLLVHDGYTVSFDIDILREGDFDETLLKRIDQCVDFILVLTDVESFTDDDYAMYKKVLNALSDTIVPRFKQDGLLPDINVLSDRMTLNQMNNCNSGLESITLAPDGNFYVCPAFYYEGKPVGNINTGPCVKNPQLYKLEHAPICSLCDAYQCKRCVWLNKKTTLEVNTPSHEQCVCSHIERNASRRLLMRLKECGYQNDLKIKRINYLDPFEKFFIN